MKIVFMGTPEFARTSLQALIDDKHQLLGVFTQPDKPRGRGMQLSASPVKELALAHGIPVYQPVSLRSGEAESVLRELAPELIVTAAYGRLLPEVLLSIPACGCINVHASLLPKYRGAAPIQWAVLNGDETTGVTVQYMAKEMDAGDVIASRETAIGEFETSGELFDRLMVLGAELLTETVRSIALGTVVRIPQDPSAATYTKMLDKGMSPIDWSRTPRQIVKQICGLDPWPVASAELGGCSLRIYKAQYTDRFTNLAPGRIVSAGKNGIEVACGEGKTLLVTEVQPAGKKRMSAAAFLLGHPMKADG
jgi:methionyl-tRNA formyltransferase